MIDKLKCTLFRAFGAGRMRIRCAAVMTALTIAVIPLLGCSLNTVKIFDGEKTYTVRTLNENIASVLASVKLKSNRYQILKTSIVNGYKTVEISYSFPVFITRDGVTTELEFSGGTVADALKQAGFTPDEHDYMEPAADTVLRETAYIDYVDIDYRTGSYTEPIPSQVETVYSNSLNEGTVTTLQAGRDGVQLIQFTEKLVNGVSVEKTVTAASVLTEAVSGKQLVGTKPVLKAVTTSSAVNCISTLSPDAPIALDASGAPLSYRSKMTVRATAYTYTGHNCATGVAPQPGYIAVNPKVIPYGTKMYIKTPDGSVIYGYAVAADTGGFVKWAPNGVDLFMASKSACTSFGVRNVEIYILE